MKKLKYCCLFRGKKYPGIAAAIVGVIVLIAATQADLGADSATAAMIFAATATLLICFLIENIPTDEERKIIADAAPPVWQTAPESLRKKVTERTRLPGRSACMAAFGCFLLMLCFLNLAEGSGKTGAVLSIVTGIGILLADLFFRLRWKLLLDESAVCAVIPVDSVYDIESTSRLSRRLFGPNNFFYHYSSYLVFYLPDGRYTLPIPSTDGRFNAVAVVRCRGMLRWTPVYQDETGIKPV